MAPALAFSVIISWNISKILRSNIALAAVSYILYQRLGGHRGEGEQDLKEVKMKINNNIETDETYLRGLAYFSENSWVLPSRMGIKQLFDHFRDFLPQGLFETSCMDFPFCSSLTPLGLPSFCQKDKLLAAQILAAQYLPRDALWRITDMWICICIYSLKVRLTGLFNERAVMARIFL